MKISYVILASILFLTVMAHSARADSQPNIPVNAWQRPAQGVSVAMFLASRMGNGTAKVSIKIYIKNVSDAEKYLPDDINDSALQIFYVDSSGNHVSFRDYTKKAPGAFLMPAMPDSRSYKSGEVKVINKELNPSELALVKAYPVFCHFRISNQKVGGYQLIESSPIMLTNAP